MLNRQKTIAICSASLTLTVAAVSTAGNAPADTLSDLISAVDTIRGASSCVPLHANPLATHVAEMATQETSDYVAHRSAQVPFTDPLPALNTIGHPTEKAVMFSGYGPSGGDAIKGTVLQDAWTKAIPECSYTQYGASARAHDDGKTVIIALVLTDG